MTRDSFVEILWNNIIESSKKNFERFPPSLMVVSGSMPFDFQSIMLYPTKMFSHNGLQTLQSIDQNNEINPSHLLSKGDKERLDQVYLK